MFHSFPFVLLVLAVLVVSASLWTYLEYRSAKREEVRYQQANQQYHCYGHGFTYEPLREYVFYQGRTRTFARLCTQCAAKRRAIPARASLQSHYKRETLERVLRKNAQ